ncbi:DUF4214 domain-containing protein [Pseudomonas sp. UMAB-08]|uniref:DUF4214 domain-containing protein n=1 Tax=Pseudomonas sp. UMAB-08 TaxID=1365375 RepID=UPI001C5A0AAE|nr:DUF4214 domain-containing protein [Pseudomonas sp. UMAB-08]
MAASTYFAQVQQLYIAYFGRPADTIGQAYWAAQIDASNGSIASVIAGFSASTESAALFGNKSTIDKVTAIYQNAFGRAPEPAGLAYWVAQLDSGKVSQAQASWTIQQSAGAGDAAAVQNKLTAAQAFTAQIDTTAEIQGYQGSAAADSARAFLKTVTADNATATAAVTGAAAAVVAATSVGVVGTTFTLTAGVDALVGTANADTFTGVLDRTTTTATTLSAGDSIDGGAGVDTLKVIVANGAAADPVASPLSGVTVKNVENISVQNVSASTAGVQVNLAPIAGVTTVTALNSTGLVNFQNLATGTEVVVSGSAQTGTVNFNQATATDAVKVTLNGGVNNVSVAATAGTATSAAINSTGGANGAVAVDTIKLTNGSTSLTTLAVNADSALRVALTASDFAAAGAALTVTGGAAVNLGVFKTIDASANTAGLTVGLSAVTSSFKGTAGADVVTGTAVAAGATIDGGAGIDTVAATLINAGNSTAFKNFEQIDLAGFANVAATPASLDAALLTGSTINGVVISGAYGAGGLATLSNLVETAAGFNVNVTGSGTNAATLGFTAASVVGTADVLNYNFGGTVAGTLAAGTITSQGIETINIASKGAAGVAITNTITVVDNAAKSIVITGDHALTLNVTGQASASAATASALTSIDASAATAGVTIVTDAATVGAQSALTIKGGSAVDSITVVTSAIANSVGATITTGAGNDTVNVTNATYKTSLSTTTITDFAKGDAIVLGTTATSNTFTSAKVDVSAAQTLGAALNIAASGVGDAAAALTKWFVYGSDTYIVQDVSAGAVIAATDTVVKLSGVLDLSTSNVAHAVAADTLTFA